MHCIDYIWYSEFSSKGFEKYIMLIMRVNPRFTNRFNGLQKPLTTSRKSFPQLSTAELHLTKSQQVEYQYYVNWLFPNYFECTKLKVSLIFLKETIVPLIRIRV